MTDKQRKQMRRAVARQTFANKSERKAFKRRYKVSLKESECHIQTGLDSVNNPVEKFPERWEQTKGTHSRMGLNHVPFEMEYGASHMTYNGERCKRSKQYRREGIDSL